MQIYEKTGDIERGTISVRLSKAEIGYKNILFVMDYPIDLLHFGISI